MKERIYRIPAGIPHTIAQLSDIHGQDGNEILKILIRRRPSLIAVSGDLFLDHAQEGDSLIDLQPKVIPLIRACAALAPTYISRVACQSGRYSRAAVNGSRTSGQQVGPGPRNGPSDRGAHLGHGDGFPEIPQKAHTGTSISEEKAPRRRSCSASLSEMASNL